MSKSFDKYITLLLIAASGPTNAYIIKEAQKNKINWELRKQQLLAELEAEPILAPTRYVAMARHYKNVKRPKLMDALKEFTQNFTEAAVYKYKSSKELEAKYNIPMPKELLNFKKFEQTGNIEYLRTAVEDVLHNEAIPFLKKLYETSDFKIPKTFYHSFKSEHLNSLVDHAKRLLKGY